VLRKEKGDLKSYNINGRRKKWGEKQEIER